jgi:hypothetical protein
VVVVEGIIFFEGRRFVKDRSENESLILIIVVVVVEEIIFAVFNSENIKNLIVSVIINLINSIISFFIAFGKYES